MNNKKSKKSINFEINRFVDSKASIELQYYVLYYILIDFFHNFKI